MGRTRLRHLIVHLPQRGCHLVRERARDDHDVALPRARAEDDTEPVLVVPRRGHVHHLYGAACETCKRGWGSIWLDKDLEGARTKGHGPHGPLACPVGNFVKRGQDMLCARKPGP